MKVGIEFDDSLGQVEVIILCGKYFGASLVFTLFKKTSMVTLEVAATFSLLGVFVGMLTHQLSLNLFFLATIGIGFGASGPKFNAKFVNSMPEEQLGTIGGGVSTYFMWGQALFRLVVSGLVLLLSVDQISWIFLSVSGFLALYVIYWLIRNQKTTQNQSV